MDRFKLITIRLKAGLKQWQLAQLLGICQSNLCAMERGRRPINDEVGQRIIKVIHAAKKKEITCLIRIAKHYAK